MKVGRNNFSTARGFTLMELVLVMLIMAIVAAIAAPNLRNFIAGRRVGDTATQIVSLAEYARSQAISEGRVYLLNIGTNSVYVTYLDANNTEQTPPGDAGEPVRLPGVAGDLTIGSDLPRGDNGDQVAHFYPTGRTEMGTITITDKDNQQVNVVCLSISENYHVQMQGGR